MSHSSNKWKKLQKILRRFIVYTSIVAVIYLTTRFSVLSIRSSINFQDKILPAGYVLIDWYFSYGRKLDASDIVITQTDVCYIIATKNNTLYKEDGILYVDNIPTNFSVASNFILPKLTTGKYLVYTSSSKHSKKIDIIDSQHIRARILMTLLQK
ncbi:hypothetical protein [Candidatus Uabimicrobium amorphum]|uniref:Peptidase S26 domain-containing protein n=1 Tax=Uabimicrobium amorphum TaxID=2596890 RepID=A0A5S9F0Y3_UABAM|nr:hypothetical protein [Candidatus Uabimicrobium amorphum]BBM81842.1 hypothetical protein UABAM_00182 [Candidatus Uabimicrobium amorphum]